MAQDPMPAMPEVPQPHFPSPYQLPTVPATCARRITMADGAEIATYVYGTYAQGSPLPVLFLHGNGEEHGIFGPMIDAVVEAGGCAVALDSRGQGRSTRGTAPLTYELMAEDAFEVVRTLDLPAVHVVGFSDGGIEALLLGRDHGQCVASLLAMGANLTPEGVDDDGELAGIEDVYRDWVLWCDAMEESGQTSVDLGLLTPTPEEARNTYELLHLMSVEPNIEAESLSAIGCPTTIMVGEFDLISWEETRRIVDAIEGAELVVVPGAGHTLPKEVPGLVIEQIFALTEAAEGR